MGLLFAEAYRDVFPASAGVILLYHVLAGLVVCFPRIRGGDPWTSLKKQEDEKFSPHPRG